MKKSLLIQFLGITIIAFVAGIAVGGYLIPQMGSQFGGAPITALRTIQTGVVASSTQHKFDNPAEWQTFVARNPSTASGCFEATFPSTDWSRVDCAAPPKHPMTVGNGGANDWVAQDSGPLNRLIGTALGNVLSETGAKSETDVCVPPFLSSCGGVNGGSGTNFFSLQYNSNPNFPVNFFGTQTTGWQQYVYVNNGFSGSCGGNVSPSSNSCGLVYIEYWLFNYGTCPPASQDPPGGGFGWAQQSGTTNCYFNANGVLVPPVAATNLPALHFIADVSVTGNDHATICVSGVWKCLQVSVPSTVLNLYQQWTAAEFNVFGAGNGSRAEFNSGTSLLVQNSLWDQSGSAAGVLRTACGKQSFTGETNNLNLGSCTTDPGATETISFAESN